MSKVKSGIWNLESGIWNLEYYCHYKRSEAIL